MTDVASVGPAFQALLSAIVERLPEVAGHLRQPEPFDVGMFEGRAGAEQLMELWRLTGGQAEETILGVLGGVQLLGPADCARERTKWEAFLGPSGLAEPSWDRSSSLDPRAVRPVYFAAGWFPILREPLEGNYLAVDLDPLDGGKAGQIILCGRDEEDKCVASPDLVALLERLTAECSAGLWELRPGGDPFVRRKGGRLLSDAQHWLPHA